MREDVGDVSELAESIKAKGILQNLTVVPAEDMNGYLVVIGNRRLAAAREAGLKTLPCVIADMTHQEQIETMLLENIQRTDLTPVEQAAGFQMSGKVSADPDVTKRDGYPCARCPKDGLVSCQWRKCRDFQPFFRQAWRDAVRPLRRRK